MSAINKWLTCFLIALGALAAPGLSLASSPETLIKKQYPDAVLKTLHEDPEKRDWVYQVTPATGETFIVAYGRTKARSGYYYILLTATPTGKIISVELPSYPHKHGRKATRSDHLKQYLNLEPSDTVLYGKNIHGVTGATSTAKTTAKKVRTLLALIKQKS